MVLLVGSNELLPSMLASGPLDGSRVVLATLQLMGCHCGWAPRWCVCSILTMCPCFGLHCIVAAQLHASLVATSSLQQLMVPNSMSVGSGSAGVVGYQRAILACSRFFGGNGT